MWWMWVWLGCSTPETGVPQATATAPTALSTFKNASVEELQSALQQGAKLIDVRTPEEFAGGHVPGADLVPLDTLDPMSPVLQKYSREEPLYVICAAGGRSKEASQQLAAAGFQVVNVQGGTNAWKGRGYPLE
jgi:rhodanese-related sulfurtransferase